MSPSVNVPDLAGIYTKQGLPLEFLVVFSLWSILGIYKNALFIFGFTGRIIITSLMMPIPMPVAPV